MIPVTLLQHHKIQTGKVKVSFLSSPQRKSLKIAFKPSPKQKCEDFGVSHTVTSTTGSSNTAVVVRRAKQTRQGVVLAAPVKAEQTLGRTM